MKTGQIFWGTLLLTVGSLFLLTKYDAIDLNLYFIWDMWPVLIILWGVSIISKNTVAKPVITLIFGIFVGAFIYGAVYNIFSTVEYCNDLDNYHESNVFFEDYSNEVDYANLKVSAGVGYFSIKDPTSKLVKGYAKGNLGTYSHYSSIKDNNAMVEVEFDDPDINIFDGNFKNRLDISLNKAPIWDIDLNIGAAKAYFDLTKFKVSNISLETGATKTKIKIGDKLDRVRVDVEMGAASLEFLIPKDFGCKLTGDMVLVIKDIPGFKKKGSKYYVTRNYDRVENRILIDINGGVSSLSVERY